jgi:hypothetical protein
MDLSQSLLSSLVVACAAAATAAQADGSVKAHQKLSALAGGMQGPLASPGESFSHDVELLEDLDGDGIRELAVGGPGCDDGGGAHGSIWILFLKPDGTVRHAQKISETSGGFVGSLGGASGGDQLGNAIASLGDLDGDGIGDLAAGTHLDESLGDLSVGSVWILFLNADGTVKAQQKIDEHFGGYVGELEEFAHFGASVEGVGDLDGDGFEDLAVSSSGTPTDLEILFLNPNGTVKHQVSVGGFGQAGLAWLGDLDGDGVGELATGFPGGGPFGGSQGAVRIVFLHADGTFKSFKTISSTMGGFTGVLSDHAQFGYAVSPAGDVNGDGVGDLLVGAPYDSDDAFLQGSCWILFLTPQGTCSGQAEISSTAGGFGGVLHDDDNFGSAVGALGDLDGDGVVDVAASAGGDNDGGAVWMLFLNGAVTSTWTNLGQGLAGSAGLPLLSGTGTLAPGSPVTLSLTQARPFSPSFLVLSNAQLAAPFKGGTLVPAPTILFAIATDGLGEVSFSGSTTAWIPPSFTHYFQVWIQDPAGPAGFAASNGLAGTTPD